MLRLRDVLARGAAYGLGAAFAGTLAVALGGGLTSHADRAAFLHGLGVLGSVLAGVFGPVGAFLWACCLGDLRRWRDLRTLRGRYDGVSVVAPTLLRVAAAAAAAGAAGWLALAVVDAAPGLALLYGRA
jgi:hypothetical protein